MPPVKKLEPAEVAFLEAQSASQLAEAAFFKAQARESVAKARAAEADAVVALIERDKIVEKRDEQLLGNEHFHVHVFDKQVADASVKTAIEQMTQWTRSDPKCEIELQINSPGGEIFSGFALFDFLQEVRSSGHKVTTVASGMAASMGGVLLQAGDKRVMGANAMLLIHEGSLGAIGDFGAVEDRVELMGQLHKRILTIFEDRAKPINPKTTKAWIKNRWARKDWWISAQDAAEYGFCDEVRG